MVLVVVVVVVGEWVVCGWIAVSSVVHSTVANRSGLLLVCGSDDGGREERGDQRELSPRETHMRVEGREGRQGKGREGGVISYAGPEPPGLGGGAVPGST